MKKRIEIKNKIVDICFLLVISILPFTMILFPITLGLLVITFFFFGDRTSYRNKIISHWEILSVVLYYFFVVIGLLLSPKYGINYSRIETQLPLLVVPLLFVFMKLDLVQITKAKNVFVFSCVLFCVVAFITLGYNFITNYEHRLNYNFVQRSMYHFHYPYDVLYVNAANIFLLFGKFNKRLKLLLSMFFFLFIILAAVRIGIFCYLIVSLIFGVVNFEYFFKIKTLIILSLFLVLTVVSINTSQYANDKYYDTLDKIGLGTKNRVSDIGEDYHKITLRYKLWSTSYEAFNKKPVLGHGPEGSKAILNELYFKKGMKELKDLNSHNQYLTSAIDHGIIGLFLLIGIFAISGYRAIGAKNMEHLLVLLLIMIAFTTESMLVRQKGVVFFSIFISILLIESSLLIQKKCQNKDQDGID